MVFPTVFRVAGRRADFFRGRGRRVNCFFGEGRRADKILILQKLDVKYKKFVGPWLFRSFLNMNGAVNFSFNFNWLRQNLNMSESISIFVRVKILDFLSNKF